MMFPAQSPSGLSSSPKGCERLITVPKQSALGGMAETEPLRSVRRHFQAIASEYEHMAAACVALRSRSLRERP